MDPMTNPYAGNPASTQSSVMSPENSSSLVRASSSDDNRSSMSGSPSKQAPATPTTSSISENKVTKPSSGGKSKKKRKTPTDVNAPKKPVSAYITYLNERRETVKTENPTMTYPDILKKLAAEWSSMMPEERKKYHEEANRAREKYNQDVSEYKTTDLYKKFCEEQKEELQQRLQNQLPPQPNAARITQPQNQQRNQKPHPPQQANVTSPKKQTPPVMSQLNSQLANQLLQPQRGFKPQLQQHQQLTQLHPPPLQSIPQPQQAQPSRQLQQQHSAIPSSEFKRELSTESHLPPHRPLLRLASSTPMSPNQTPSPGVAPPNFNPPNLSQQYCFQAPNSSAQMSKPMPMSTTNSMPLQQNTQTTSVAGQDGLMKSRTPSSTTSRQDSLQSYDIPIFTEQFLEHNKAREGELRHLKKHNGQLEEQNAMLSKHVENMKAAIGKLDSDALHQRTHNRSLQQQLDNLRVNLSAHLGALPLPGSKDPPNRDNIDDYMNTVYRMMTESPKPENQHFINLFKEMIWNLEFNQTQT